MDAMIVRDGILSSIILFALVLLSVSCESSVISDGDSSATVWKYSSVGLFLGRAGIDDRRVIVAVKDTLIALDQKTGNARWKIVPTGVAISAADLPIRDGIVYFVNNGFAIAVSADTGNDVWRTRLLPAIGTDLYAGAVEVGTSRVYAVKRGGGVYGLDRNTGALLWNRSLVPQPIRMIEVEGMVCVAADDQRLDLPQGAITCLDGATGEIVWRYEVPDFGEDGQRLCHQGGVLARPALAGDLLLFGEGCGQLIALEVDTGRPVWNVQFNTAFDTAVLVAGDEAYACTRAPGCLSLRVSDGSVLWTTPIQGSVVKDPILVGNDLYVLALGGTIHRFERTTGRILNEIRVSGEDGSILTAPVYADGMIFSGNPRVFYGIRAP
jgi:outer membrane protein assembly factor BamB